jgi:hypothetical protein
MIRIVFLNVGNDTLQAELLCRSARVSNPKATLTQVTDKVSPKVSGVDEIVRFDESTDNLMFFRTLSFSKVKIEQPTYFLDTDMLLMKELPELNGVGFCVREFQKSAIFNHNFRGMDLSEHKGKSLGDVYPIIGCATFSNGSEIWPEILSIYERLPPKYRTWYGDQEALKRYVELNPDYFPLNESQFACLPEFFARHRERARIVHFKGTSRKPVMIRAAKDLGIA